MLGQGSYTMTSKEIDKRESKIIEQKNKCFICGKPMQSPQFAHFIANTKANRNKYGSFVIDSIFNGAMVCSLDCNDSCNIGFNLIKSLELAKNIYENELKKLGGLK